MINTVLCFSEEYGDHSAQAEIESDVGEDAGWFA